MAYFQVEKGRDMPVIARFYGILIKMDFVSTASRTSTPSMASSTAYL